MLPIKISKAEIQWLSYERYHYPCLMVQKRIHAVYLKATTYFPDEEIVSMVGSCRDSVSDWCRNYEQEGLEGLCVFKYGANRSELKNHAENILESFTLQPSLSCNEAINRIKKITGIVRSPSQIRSFMHRHGLHYIKMGHIPAKADSEKQREWVEKR